MQQLHQGQVLGTPGQTPAVAPSNGSPAFGGSPQAASAVVAGNKQHAIADSASLDDLISSAAREADAKGEARGSNAIPGEKKAKKEKETKATRLIYSDDTVSPEEKMASLPRYAFDPSKREQTA